MFSVVDQNDFELILENAKAEGWIAPEDAVTLSQAESSVVVTHARGAEIQQRRYEHDSRWPYRFLRDLASGVWRARCS